MFHKQIQLFDVDGCVSETSTVSQLKELSSDVLTQQRKNALCALDKFKQTLASTEVNLQAAFGYPTIEATRAGMTKYADGTIELEVKKINEMVANLPHIPGQPPRQPQDPVKAAKAKENLSMLVNIGKSYVDLVKQGAAIEKTAKILSAIMTEKQNSEANQPKPRFQ